MTKSKIEWTDRSDWNPIRGCTRISPGCGGPGDHGGCYAEVMAARFSDPGQWGHRFATRTAKGGRWTGLIAVQWDRVELPLRWRKSAIIFASSTSDFFHKDLALDDIAHIFGVMIAAHHLRGHMLQVLTKRADIMRAHLNDPEFWEIANATANQYIMEAVDPLDRRSDDARATCDDYGPDNPPPGIWLGVSVEDQTRADERIPDLLTTPAAVRFISAEPLLGPVDLDCPDVDWAQYPAGQGLEPFPPEGRGRLLIDWIIVGGESGPGARPLHPAWARSLRDQCAEVDVPFFFKQWGEHIATPAQDARWKDGSPVPADLEPVTFTRVGKKAAGRLRDGRHFADAASPEIAEALAHVLNGQVLLPPDLSAEQQDCIQKVLWP